MNALIALDHQLFHGLNAWGQGGLTGVFFETLTWWGHAGVCGPFLIALFWSRRRASVKIAWRNVLIYTAVLAVVVVTLKMGFDRPRPASVFAPGDLHILGEKLTRRSFPSGHTATAAWACLSAFLMTRWSVFTLLFGVLALVVGLSRVVVGAHFPADVVAGYLIAGGTFIPFYVRQASTKGEMPNGE